MRYQLTLNGERVEGFRERQVGGISIKREALDPQQWVTALAADLQRGRAQRRGARGAREAVGLIRRTDGRTDPGGPATAPSETPD